MSESNPEPARETDAAVTVANIQRIESGYFDHMESLRDRIPVDDYLNDARTGRAALIAMAGLTLGLLVLFPLTMFYQFTFLVIVLYLIAFVAVGWWFYENVMEPYEAAETWRD